jgi:CheY-like chemotaxis protein
MGGRILVVEDEHVTRTNICDFLRQEGYQVNEAPDGAQALEMVKKGRFDLIISDFVLPKLNGLNLVEHVHSFSPKVPVIL